MRTEDYTVRLSNFEGPLDLLLHLIREAEVEITDIPIASITEQYVQHLELVEEIDIDLAGEFLVMAATLMEIKSRCVSPRPRLDATEETGEAAPASPTDSADPRAELVRQLLEYKRSRDAADALDRRRLEWERRHPAGAAGLDRRALIEASVGAGDLDLEDLELYDLVEAFAKIAEQVNFDALGEHHVSADEDVPLEIHAEDILDQLRRRANPAGESEIPFREIFAGRRRVEMVGLFLAMLELVRRSAIRIRQSHERGEIVLRASGEAMELLDSRSAEGRSAD